MAEKKKKNKKSAAKPAAAPKTPAKKKFRAPMQIIMAFVCLLMFVMQLSVIFQPEGGIPLAVRGLLLGLFGEIAFYILIPAFLYLFIILAVSKKWKVGMRASATLIFVLICGTSLQLMVPEVTYGGFFRGFIGLIKGGVDGTSAGLICGSLGLLLKLAFGNVLSYLVVLVLGAIFLLRAFEITIRSLYAAIENRPRDDDWDDEDDGDYDPAANLVNKITNHNIERRRRQRERRKDEEYELYEDVEDDYEDDYEEPTPKRPRQNPRLPEAPAAPKQEQLPPPRNNRAARDEDKADKIIRQMELEVDGSAGKGKEKPAPKVEKAEKENAMIPNSMPEFDPDDNLGAAPKLEAKQKKKADNAAAEQVIKELNNQKPDTKPYSYPPISLLKNPPHSSADGTMEMRENSRRLNETLASFKIDAHIINVTRGPSVTRYEVELDKGVRLNKLTTCADDIALSLGAPGVRIAAVPGKISVVGIEVPNRAVTMVSLREVIDSQEFHNSKGLSTFAVGKDIGGSAIVGNIAKMPHMLIAGTTGSGKSVCMNSIIISLLYKASPEDVKLIMVDPKMVELANYNGIPHLMIPVVTDPKKAAGALQWAVTEMMRRYKTMSDAGVRDLESYNSIVTAEGGAKVPQLIVIIDELADLMMVAAKEVEDSICRIAQMGRASGVHLVIATQRPSADVITGLMKANIPSRIAFSVASAMESRIILDTQGAEKLVGKGDMLFAPIGSGKPLRVQGCFVSDDEVLKVTTYVKEKSTANYDQEVLADIEKKAQQTGKKSAASALDAEPNADELAGDELLPQAVEIVLETGQASVSMLQRRLKLGYARAARIVDEMEEKGIVGPHQGAKPRDILITKEQWEEIQSFTDTQMTLDDMEEPFTHAPEDF